MKTTLFIVFTLLFVESVAQDYYFTKENGLDSCWVYHSDVRAPCEVLDSFMFVHRQESLHPNRGSVRDVHFSIDDKKEYLYYLILDRKTGRDSNEMYVYRYSIATKAISKLFSFSMVNSSGRIGYDVEYLDHYNRVLATNGWAIYLYDMVNGRLKKIPMTRGFPNILEQEDEIYVFELFPNKLYRLYIDGGIRLEKDRKVSTGPPFSSPIDCYGYCRAKRKCIIRDFNYDDVDYEDSLKVVDFNNWDKEYSRCYMEGLTEHYASYDIVDFHILLDLDKGDDYCTNSGLEIDMPCTDDEVSLSDSTPDLIVTSDRVDSMEVYIQGGLGSYLTTGHIPSKLRVKGSGSGRLWVYDRGGASLEDYAHLIQGLRYHRGGSAKASTLVVFTLHSDRFTSEATIATIGITGGSPAYAGRDTVVRLCPLEEPSSLSSYIPAGAGVGRWDPSEDEHDPSKGDATYRYIVETDCGRDTARLDLVIQQVSKREVRIDTLICVGEQVELYGERYSRDTLVEYERVSIESCSIEMISLRVRVETPTVELSTQSVSVCEGEDVVVEVKNPREGYSYSWSDGVDGPKRSLTTKGQYVIKAERIAGCTSSDTVNFSHYTFPELMVENHQYTKKRDEAIQMEIETSEDVTIRWQPTQGLSCTDCLSPTVSINESQGYVVHVENTWGCSVEDTIWVEVEEAPRVKNEGIVLPNIMHASSAANGHFGVVSGSVISYDMRIYDRWGGKVYEGLGLSPGSDQGWDGKLNGRHLSEEVYIYTIEYRDKSGETDDVVGTVLVVR